LALSSGVKNHAFVGESGNRKLFDDERVFEARDVRDAHKKSAAVMRVSIPVMIISLEGGQSELRISEKPTWSYHCQGSNPPVRMCNEPKLMKPEII